VDFFYTVTSIEWLDSHFREMDFLCASIMCWGAVDVKRRCCFWDPT